LKLTIVGAAALFAAACGAKAEGPPGIVIDRTACSHCTMLVSEVAYAAAYQAAGREARVFDDIACMLEGMRRDGLQSAKGTDLRVWFHDAGDSTWIEGATAVFLVSPEIKTPMGGGIVAYRDAPRAEQAAARHHGRVVRSLSELMREGEE
jgi:nitrous oxide reductase accessory protein NosL